jgi:hypothetical protein
LLKPGGRLVFFVPTVNDEYAEVDIPLVDGMSLISNSLQDFGSWGRRVCQFPADKGDLAADCSSLAHYDEEMR